MNNKDYLSALPKVLDVGWTKFEFLLVDKLKDAHENPCFGLCDFDGTCISLDSSLVGVQALNTIIHECFHALYEALGMGTSESEEDIIKTSNENLTETTTKAILLFRNLNPELWELLFTE